MQQHLMQMQPMMAAYYPNNVTTDHIQQVLFFPFLCFCFFFFFFFSLYSFVALALLFGWFIIASEALFLFQDKILIGDVYWFLVFWL